MKVSNTISTTQSPSIFLTQGGLDDALTTLRAFHKISVMEANKSKDIEDDVVTQLNGLRSDLSQKIKEIKSLSGDFKNSVEKEQEATRKAVDQYKSALQSSETESSSVAGKNDPYIIRLAVDRQVERQIEEENYLHRVGSHEPESTLLTPRLTHYRHISTSKDPVESLRRLWSARSRRPTMHM